MTDMTYGFTAAQVANSMQAPEHAARKTMFARFIDVLIEGRMRQAKRYTDLHLALAHIDISQQARLQHGINRDEARS